MQDAQLDSSRHKPWQQTQALGVQLTLLLTTDMQSIKKKHFRPSIASDKQRHQRCRDLIWRSLVIRVGCLQRAVSRDNVISETTAG